MRVSRALFKMGLSPYTRGNQRQEESREKRLGSIPVHTGKPYQPLGRFSRSGVYPRTHGETRHSPSAKPKIAGLSPYTRGNPFENVVVPQYSGSIPVHTGKPLSDMPIFLVLRVYPRTHGETLSQLLQGLQNQGLSPYTRGNLINHWEDSPAAGSIPVHTGKPDSP